MISHIPEKDIDDISLRFTNELKINNFLGDIALDYDQRYTMATDNSIYQLIPKIVLYPKNTNDISIAVKLINSKKFQHFTITARGGGTGTNGQSLTNSIMLDTSRYMTKIIKINVKEQWAKVESGVIKDQLNDEIAKHNLFFAPELSTSDRATIGGMVSTDASGQGSLVYGKTSDHVLQLTSVLSDGSIHVSQPISSAELNNLQLADNKIAIIYKTLNNIYQAYKDDITNFYSKLRRCVSGYNLKYLYDAQGNFNLNSVLCGSEGTLAIISEVKIKLTPIPKHRVLVVAYYNNFITALKDANNLLALNPDSIETIDDKVLSLAKTHGIWQQIKHLIADTNNVNAMHFIEFTGNLAKKLINNQADDLLTNFNNTNMLGYKLLSNPEDIQKILTMRKLSVGLLGRMHGNARPIPFVEDTIVPPEYLADFISDFIEILDSYQLSYGMFGHTDAGVMHVRPAIDMKQESPKILIREITDKIVTLTQKYGGVLWGEHGKGFRSEYNSVYYGKLNKCLQQIKTAFDPYNKLNPGKISVAEKTKINIIKIDQPATRGEADKIITTTLFSEFSQGLYCNGNSACFNYNHNQLMCPTFKVTKNRIHSPKGRSGLVRDWLRQQTLAKVDIAELIKKLRTKGKSMFWSKLLYKLQNITNTKYRKNFNHQVYNALDQCTGCKSCAGQCPININIPDIKSRFFELYFSCYFRPLKHYLAANLEVMLPYLAYSKVIYNKFASNNFINSMVSKLCGLRDIPQISCISPTKTLCAVGAQTIDIAKIQALPVADRDNMVILIQDAYTSFFDTNVITSYVTLLQKLGYTPLIANYFPSGKAMHVLGFLHKFNKLVAKNYSYLQQLSQLEIPMIGIDAATTLMYRDEYKQIITKMPKIELLSEWLSSKLDRIKKHQFNLEGEFTLLTHCTELSMLPNSSQHWQHIFSAFGLKLKHQATGCCGMAGLYGHESSNYQNSHKIYQLSWQKIINNTDNINNLVATGYSCRSQVKRFANKTLPHPVEAIVNQFKKFY